MSPANPNSKVPRNKQVGEDKKEFARIANPRSNVSKETLKKPTKGDCKKERSIGTNTPKKEIPNTNTGKIPKKRLINKETPHHQHVELPKRETRGASKKKEIEKNAERADTPIVEESVNGILPIYPLDEFYDQPDPYAFPYEPENEHDGDTSYDDYSNIINTSDIEPFIPIEQHVVPSFIQNMFAWPVIRELFPPAAADTTVHPNKP
jgi:hypothetical protein